MVRDAVAGVAKQPSVEVALTVIVAVYVSAPPPDTDAVFNGAPENAIEEPAPEPHI